MNNQNTIDANGGILIKDIVTQNIRTVQIFEKYNIDFYCNGNKKLEEAITGQKINLEQIIEELKNTVMLSKEDSLKFGKMNLADLALYIVNTHHTYVKKAIPQIRAKVKNAINTNGEKYPFLKEIESHFAAVSVEMNGHMQKEENVLFPMIRYLVDCKKYNENPQKRSNITIKNPIRVMEEEHVNASSVMSVIRELANGDFTLESADEVLKQTYNELIEFELDLHKHIHLENNILFPKAIKLEQELLNKFD